MYISAVAPFAAILVGMTAIILLISRNWRVSISALGAQYLGVFLLIAMVWPIEYAVIKLIAGWITAAVLGMGMVEKTEAWEDELGDRFSGTLFRLFLVGLVSLLVISAAPEIANWLLTATYQQIIGGLLLIGIGILHLGLTAKPVRVILGLLTVLSGFEIFYATMETSLLVNAILAIITFSLALAGAYLYIVPTLES